jgi:hypothetical protein
VRDNVVCRAVVSPLSIEKINEIAKRLSLDPEDVSVLAMSLGLKQLEPLINKPQQPNTIAVDLMPSSGVQWEGTCLACRDGTCTRTEPHT